MALLPILLALIGGFAAGALRLHRLVKIASAVAAPGVAVAAYYLINPDPGCAYDCPGQIVLGVILPLTVGAWWLGLILGALTRWRGARKTRFVKPS